ncbi:uncharacterized protein LOC129906276 [Episyrphus balteatus]|uniref:uncharacterized protein LOC129906276 n=1 Tax=Episyrphus balteatus TaxID=286459 RepID=UPI0024851D20|nr:uncharacterized protein LOC129906276 [Episyrphus balteatus]
MSEEGDSFDIFTSIGAIYLLNKEELKQRMAQLGLSTEGTVAALRASFSAHIKEARVRKSMQNLCEEMERLVAEREYHEDAPPTIPVSSKDSFEIESVTVYPSGSNTNGKIQQPEYTEYQYRVPELQKHQKPIYTPATYAAINDLEKMTRHPDYRDWYYPSNLPRPAVTTITSAAHTAITEFEQMTKLPEYRPLYYPDEDTQNTGPKTTMSYVPCSLPGQHKTANRIPNVETPTTSVAAQLPSHNPRANYPRTILPEGWSCDRIPMNREAEVLNVVRKWGLRFDGSGSALEFIKRIEELTESYRIQSGDMSRAIPEIFRGTALEWYRINRGGFRSWEDFHQAFLGHFLPIRFVHKLEDEISRKRQGPREKAKDFIRATQYLIHQHPTMRITDNIDRIYDRLRPEYHLYIRRKDFKTLEELTGLAEEFEFIQNESRNQTPATVPAKTNPRNPFRNTSEQFDRRPVEVYDRKTHCWKCKQRGHSQANCLRPFRKFCSFCGKDGILTRDCSCHTQDAAILSDLPKPTEPTVKTESPIPDTTEHTALKANEVETDESNHINNPCEHKELETLAIQEGNPKLEDAIPGQAETPQIEVNLDPRYFIPIVINGLQLSALIDTGATKSFINKKVRRLLKKKKVPMRDLPHSVRMANGAPVYSNEHYNVSICIGNEEVQGELTYFKQLKQDVILGMDLLNLFDFVMTIKGKEIKTLEIPQVCSKDQMCVLGGKPLSLTQQDRLNELLNRELPNFDRLPNLTNAAVHRIRLKTNEPFRQRYYPRNPAMQRIIDEEIDELLADGRIEPSNSPYSSPIVLVKKKNGTWRVCVDYRQLNEISIMDAYPLPQILAVLDKLKQANFISTIDLKQGYWQIPLEEESRPVTAFTVPGRGLFQWRVLPCGLNSSAATFQRMLDSVLGPEMDPFAFAYLDDIIVISKTFEEHLEHLKEVFKRLQAAHLRINREKCEFCKRELKYLGYVVSDQGISTDPDKISAVRELNAPRNVRELRRVLGIASWYRRFIKSFSVIATPLTQLLKKIKSGNGAHRKKQHSI